MSESKAGVEKAVTLVREILDRSWLDVRFEAKAGSADGGSAEETAGGPGRAKLLEGEFSGAEAAVLTARNGELLLALEHIATQVMRLEPEEHDRVSFDADGFKGQRESRLKAMAERAIAMVGRTGRPYAFPPMTSRERRLLHLELADCGLETGSEGEGPRRHVVLQPGRHATGAAGSVQDRVEALKSRFRRR